MIQSIVCLSLKFGMKSKKFNQMIFKSYTRPEWVVYSSKLELKIIVNIEDEVIFDHKSKYMETPISLSAAKIFIEKYLSIVTDIDSCEFCVEYSENKNCRIDLWHWQKQNSYFNYDRLMFLSRKLRKQ